MKNLTNEIKLVLIEQLLELKRIEVSTYKRLTDYAKNKTTDENIRLVIFNDPGIYNRITVLEDQIEHLENELKYVRSSVYPES